MFKFELGQKVERTEIGIYKKYSHYYLYLDKDNYWKADGEVMINGQKYQSEFKQGININQK